VRLPEIKASEIVKAERVGAFGDRQDLTNPLQPTCTGCKLSVPLNDAAGAGAYTSKLLKPDPIPVASAMYLVVHLNAL
jgi:hypothetical protein